MIHAAQMFAVDCAFSDTRGLRETPELAGSVAQIFRTTTAGEVRDRHARIIALDNLAGAKEVYGLRAGSHYAVVVGNERRGISRGFHALATDLAQIPMQSRRINCLNVAAASAVALYYLRCAQVGPMATRSDPASRRPELLLLGAGDPIELGSAVRSAAAFGWHRAFIEDRDGIWFGCDRVTRSEGRAAARRGRNDIRLAPIPRAAALGFAQVVVVTTQRIGTPIRRVNLARGGGQLLVIPDESRVHAGEENWGRLGPRVEFARLDLPAETFTYHYRLIASVALAEASRQVGRRAPGVKAPRIRPPVYDTALERLALADGEVVSLDNLMQF